MIDYLIGTKEDFFEFVNNISVEDNVAVLTHSDLDGIASGIFLQKILESKNKKIDFMDFMDYKKELFEELSVKLELKQITKVFISDIGADTFNLEGFEEFRNNFDVFLIDHHPFNSKLRNKTQIIKTDSSDCSALVIYDLGEGLIDEGEWIWLVCAAIFSDYSYKKEENLNLLRKFYPDVTQENISSSTPGINGRKISNALIYYKDNKQKVYDLVIQRNLEKLNEVSDIVEEEINKFVEEFSEKAEFYPERKLYWYEIDPKFNIASIVSTVLSKMKIDYTFILVNPFEGGFKISARNQSGNENLNELMKRGTQYLEGASGGGHPSASAARIRLEDLNRFKQRILKA